MNRILFLFSSFFILLCSELIGDLALNQILVLPMPEKELNEWRVVRHALTDKAGMVCYYPASELDWRCSKCLELSCLHRSSFEPWANESVQVLADHLIHCASENLGCELERTIVAIEENEALIECYCPETTRHFLYKIFLTKDWCQAICVTMVDELWQTEKEHYIELIKGAKLVSLQDPSLNRGLSVVPTKEVPEALKRFFPDFSFDHFTTNGDNPQSYIFFAKEPNVEAPEILTFTLASLEPLSLQCLIDLHKLELERRTGMKLSFKTHFRSPSQALVAASNNKGLVIFKVFALRQGFAILTFAKDSKKPMPKKEIDTWMNRFKAVKLPSDW